MTNTIIDKKENMSSFSKQVADALQNPNSKGNIKLGRPNSDVTIRIKELTGIDVSNRNQVLSKDYIRHMAKHKKETNSNQISLTEEDIKKIPYIISGPDNIVRGSNTLASDRKEIMCSIRYIKTDHSGKMFVIEAIPNKGYLQIKTMWKEPTTLIHDTNARHHTPKAVSDTSSSTSDSTIAQNQ
jgi:hypothetical protein